MSIKPGVYLDMPAGTYHAAEALSAGVAWEMITGCPAQAVYGSPFDPGDDDEEDDASDETRERLIGVAAHLAILEPDLYRKRAVIVQADSWRTNAAKTQRDEARANGQVALLAKQERLVDRIRRRVLAKPKAAALLKDGHSEASLFWTEDGIPMKARPDRLSAGAIVDLKTCADISRPAIMRKADTEGWALRARWYLDGAARVAGIAPERMEMEYVFLCVRQRPPHLVKAYKLSHVSLEIGAVQKRDAMAKFAECRRQGVWSDFGDEIETLEPADWTLKRFFERYENDMTPRAREMLTELVP